jgi:hypothetical protein
MEPEGLLPCSQGPPLVPILVRWIQSTHPPPPHFPKIQKGKNVKLSLSLTKLYAMKMYWGSGGIALRFLDLSTRWRLSGQLHALLPYPQGESARYTMDRRLVGPHSRSEHGGVEKNSQPLLGIEPCNPDRPDRSLVTTRTEFLIYLPIST